MPTTTNQLHKTTEINKNRIAWHALPVAEVTTKLGSDATHGLSEEEAARRLELHGPNELQVAEETRWYTVLVRQFVDVLIGILLIAAAISLIIGELTDAMTILVIIVLNGALGFVQEWKAEQALKALKQMLSPHCRVLRDGRDYEVEATLLVPGDVVELEVGDRIPADLRLIVAINLKVDESALTGESDSVSKYKAPVTESTPLAERSPVVLMGTAVTNGRARGIVVETGTSTEFGRVAELTQAISFEKTPLQQRLGTLGKQLGILAVVVSSLIALAGWLAGKPLLNMFLTGVSLAVAVVPEGLPAVVTITLALGIRAMVRRKALLRRLPAAEALGSATIVCTDKTGTLTQNQMTVQKIWLATGEIDVTGVGYDPAGHFEVNGQQIEYREQPDLLALLETGLRCNHARLLREDEAWRESGEPTEAALVVAAYKAWLSPDGVAESVSEFSFNSDRKRMTVVEHHPGKSTAHVKGAPEVILARCDCLLENAEERDLSETDRRTIQQAYEQMAESGLRVLAVARRTLPAHYPIEEDRVEQKLTLLGLVGIIDPPRPEVPAAIKTARNAGIHVIMITGDAAPTAHAIARRIGLPAERAVTGTEIAEMDDDALRDTLLRDVVIARATPEQKLRIVTLLQGEGHIVGMTGDGVNDAPALKKAEIGIAMGLRGTDVAKGAADIILTDDNFSSIISAVEEGRRQYDNIQKFVRYLLSSNMGEVVAIFVNILLGGPLILLPVQILWMNLVTDGMTAVALGLEPVEADVMNRPPRDPKKPILDMSGAGMVLILGSYMGGITIWLLYYYLNSHDPQSQAIAQTVAFTGIIIAEKINVLNFRALRTPIFSVSLFTNPWVLIALVGTIGLQVCAVYVPFLQTALHTVPIGLTDWALIVAVAAPILVISEVYKWCLR